MTRTSDLPTSVDRTSDPAAIPAARDERPALTDRQAEVLTMICDSIRDRGYAPTLREIGARMNIGSTNGVNDHLIALERKGYIRRDAMNSRAIQVLHGPPLSDEQQLAMHRERARFHQGEATRIAARIALTASRAEGDGQ